jgi:hypothetical protein
MLVAASNPDVKVFQQDWKGWDDRSAAIFSSTIAARRPARKWRRSPECLLLAQSGPLDTLNQCPLSGE